MFIFTTPFLTCSPPPINNKLRIYVTNEMRPAGNIHSYRVFLQHFHRCREHVNCTLPNISSTLTQHQIHANTFNPLYNYQLSNISPITQSLYRSRLSNISPITQSLYHCRLSNIRSITQSLHHCLLSNIAPTTALLPRGTPFYLKPFYVLLKKV